MKIWKSNGQVYPFPTLMGPELQTPFVSLGCKPLATVPPWPLLATTAFGKTKGPRILSQHSTAWMAWPEPCHLSCRRRGGGGGGLLREGQWFIACSCSLQMSLPWSEPDLEENNEVFYSGGWNLRQALSSLAIDTILLLQLIPQELETQNPLKNRASPTPSETGYQLCPVLQHKFS